MNILTDDTTNNDNEEFTSLDDYESAAPAADEVEAEKPAVVIPEKFKGKSLEDVISSYTQLEKEFGRQSNDFGELRKLTDKFLMERMTPKDDAKPKPVSVSFEDIVDDPTNAVGKLVESSTKELKEELDTLKKEKRLNSFKSQFPDYEKDLSDPDFQAWVSGSKYRVNLFQKADNYDVDAGTELWTAWAERKDMLKKAVAAEQTASDDAKKTALKKATTESSSTSTARKPKFKRVDIIRLIQKDPARYEALHDEIMLAYQEGRVI